MQNIVIGRYSVNSQHPLHAWDGWAEAEDRSWILFIPADGGVPSLMVHRDVSSEEAIARGLPPYDPETKRGVRGDYVDPGSLKEGEKITPNRPVEP